MNLVYLECFLSYTIYRPMTESNYVDNGLGCHKLIVTGQVIQFKSISLNAMVDNESQGGVSCFYFGHG